MADEKEKLQFRRVKCHFDDGLETLAAVRKAFPDGGIMQAPIQRLVDMLQALQSRKKEKACPGCGSEYDRRDVMFHKQGCFFSKPLPEDL